MDSVNKFMKGTRKNVYLLKIAVLWMCQGVAVLKVFGFTHYPTWLNPQQWSSAALQQSRCAGIIERQ